MFFISAVQVGSKKITSIIILLLYKHFLFAQVNVVLFGQTNLIKEGEIVIIGAAPSEFYSMKFLQDTVSVSNHKFKFEGVINEIQPVRFVIIRKGSTVLSEPFFIEKGEQKVIIDSSSSALDVLEIGFRVSVSGSKTNNEYTNRFLPLLYPFNEMIKDFFENFNSCDSIINKRAKEECIETKLQSRMLLRRLRDSVLLSYAKTYPESKILPWLLYSSVRRYRYNDFYEETMNTIEPFLSPGVKRNLVSLLNSQKYSSVGVLFPLSDLAAANNFQKRPAYILVEFWNTYCLPCIKQFTALKPLYSKYNKKGFEVVAIAIDERKNIDRYKKILKQNQYNWKQVFDTLGVRSKKINIIKFPTNFLLDSSNNIIAIDINIDQLSGFLLNKLQ